DVRSPFANYPKEVRDGWDDAGDPGPGSAAGGRGCKDGRGIVSGNLERVFPGKWWSERDGREGKTALDCVQGGREGSRQDGAKGDGGDLAAGRYEEATSDQPHGWEQDARGDLQAGGGHADALPRRGRQGNQAHGVRQPGRFANAVNRAEA